MTDHVTVEKRSAIMARVRQKDTGPEMVVRRLLHKMGFRYRLHRHSLPGTPDIVLPKHGAVIFVHGCFWHGHSGCRKSGRPKNNAEFWNAKLDRNLERDAEVLTAIRGLGWRTLVVWQCETSNKDALMLRLTQFLQSVSDMYPNKLREGS